MIRPVAFTVLGDWSPATYINEFVWVAFAERLVATGERHGPDNFANICAAEEFLGTWSLRLVERDWEWMAPIIGRLANGDDPLQVEAQALAEYSRMHDGRTPLMRDWELDPDRYRA
ncbi:hypothetical protein ACFSEO_05870 [Agromyces cerinus subsp. nitratus]|uniref:hypothetical protein n=1 Tax=Agromyces cerinus TaxID=33878 RepID=UPI0036338380